MNSAENVSVKLLEWKELGAGRFWPKTWYGTGVFSANYKVEQSHPGGSWHSIGGNFATFEDAKAAAQADYEQRVLSCLRSPPTEDADRVEAVAWPPLVGDKIWVEFTVKAHCSMGQPAWVSISAPGISASVDYEHRSVLSASSRPETVVSDAMVEAARKVIGPRISRKNMLKALTAALSPPVPLIDGMTDEEFNQDRSDENPNVGKASVSPQEGE